jgi:membrane-bound lytic murein transglycosylase MltF
MKKYKIMVPLAVAFLLTSAAFAQTSDKGSAAGKAPSASSAPAQPAKKAYALPDVTAQKWTGDLDGMIQRRLIRVLVTYSKTHYFVDKGTQRGLTYDFGRMFEDDLNKKLKKKHLRVHVVFVPVARDELIPALLQGRGDMAAANLTITPGRLKQVDFSDPTIRNVSEIVVTGPGSEPIATAEDLSGKEVYVRKSSSYYESLEKLNAELAKAGKKPVKVRFAPEELETEDILEMVNAGLVKITIADDHLAEFWSKIFKKMVLNRNAAVRTGGNIGVMIRPNSPQLKAELNSFLARYPEGSGVRNQLLQKYLKNVKYAKEATSKEEIAKFEATVDFFRKYGDKYDLDYLLIMAQGYQESRLDQNAKSPVGAIGVMQVMPATGKDLNVGDITKIEPNIHAGVKYIRFMMNQFYADEPMDNLNKGLFTFASYNAGPGRIAQLRKLAAKRGLDPNKWFNNVEVLAAEKIGRETVTYVSNIYKYYLAYKLVTEEMAGRRKAREEVQSGGSK